MIYCYYILKKIGCHDMQKKLLVYALLFLMLFSCFDGVKTGADPALSLSFSQQGGYYPSQFSLMLTANIAGADIYYTFNNSDPDPEKLGKGTYKYSSDAPIQIKDVSGQKNNYAPKSVFGTSFTLSEDINIPKCTVVKAIAKTPSQITSVSVNSYIVDKLVHTKYNLPVISLTTDADNLYDPVSGLFSNFDLQNSSLLSDYEKPFHMEYYDENGKRVINQNIGVRLHGNSTKNLPQKTLRLYARSEYDNHSSFSYEMFPWKKSNSGSAIKKYKRLLLRNSGNDFGSTMIRDAFNQILVRDLNVDIQEYRPAVAYVCGEFYGLVNIRERYDNEYCEENFGVNKNDVVLINDPNPNGGGLDEGSPGDEKAYVDLHRFVDNNDMRDDANLASVDAQFDLDNLQDYYMMENYIANTDWPVKNTRIWRSKQAKPVPGVKGVDGRWRYMISDTDISTDMWQNPVQAAQFDAFDFIMDTSGGFPTYKRFFQRLMTNETFKNTFIARYVKNINTTYHAGRVKNLMDATVDKLVKTMPYVDQRYNVFSGMYTSKDNFMTFYRCRGDNVLEQISQKYNMGGIVHLTVDDAAVSCGSLFVDGMQIKRYMLENNAFKGKYFNGLTTTLKVQPDAGYEFVKWQIEKNGATTYHTDPTLKIIYSDDHDIQVKPVYKSVQGGEIISPDIEDYPSLSDYELVGDNFDNHIRNGTSSAAWQGNWSSNLQIKDGVGMESSSALYMNGVRTISALRRISPYAAGKWAHVSFDAKPASSSPNSLWAGIAAYGTNDNNAVSYAMPDTQCVIVPPSSFEDNSGYVHFDQYIQFPAYAEIRQNNQAFMPDYFKFEFSNAAGSFYIDNVHVDLVNEDPFAPTPSPLETSKPVSPAPTPTPDAVVTAAQTPEATPSAVATVSSIPTAKPTSPPPKKKISGFKISTRKITVKTTKITGKCKANDATVLIYRLKSKKWVYAAKCTVKNGHFTLKIKKQRSGTRLKIYAKKAGMISSKNTYFKVRKK